MILLPLIALFGCEPQENKYEDAANRIEEALQQKYGEEFVVEKIGGGFGTVNTNTIKSMASPKSDPSIKFQVEITKDLEKVYDKYLNEIVAQSNVKPIEKMARKFWSDAKVTITNDTVWTYPTHVDRNMTYEEFLKLYPSNWQLITVMLDGSKYLNDENRINVEEELSNYLEFSDLLIRGKFLKSYVSIDYLTHDAYQRIDNIYHSNQDASSVLSKETDEGERSNFLARNGYEITASGEIKESNDELIETFDYWDEQRKKLFQGDSGS